MAISFGFLLPTRERVMQAQPETAAILALAEQAEALGDESLWAGDSPLARPRHGPLTQLAAVAARTTRAMVGTAVLLPALGNPVVLAQQLATLDQISTGRLILGVGIGADNRAIRAEFPAAGVPFEARLGRTLEGLRVCRALWTGAPVQWQGAGSWTTRCWGLCPTVPAAHRSGWALAHWPACSAPASISMAGFHSGRTPRPTPHAGLPFSTARNKPSAAPELLPPCV